MRTRFVSLFGAALLLVTACSSPPRARWVDHGPIAPPPPAEVTLAFAGDVHFAGRTLTLLNDPDSAFGSVTEVLSAADVAVVNLETAVTTGGTPEPKRFHFRAPATAFRAVKAAGIDAVSLANNHTLDYGRAGLADTLRHARTARVPVLGAGLDAEAAYAPWITQVAGTRIAVVGLSQIRELADRWGAAGGRPGIAMAHNPNQATRAVRAAKRRADVVIAFLHWGQEGNECPTGRMIALAEALAKAGATAVIGTHAHLLQGDGWLGDTYVAYGLGNFLWWRDNAFSNRTGVLRLTLRGTKLTRTELVPAWISRTGQPVVVKGDQARRFSDRFARLRDCTGLSDPP